MKITILLAALPLFLLVAACATYHDVRPGADGIHRVLVRAQSKEHAEESAIRQANNYCDDVWHSHAAFVDEKPTQYTGTMDEETRDTVHKASTAAMVIGGMGSVMANDPGVRGGGAVVGAAGTAGAIMTSGNDYTADMRFKCQ